MYKSSEHTAVRPASSGVQLPASPLVMMTQETNGRQWDYHIRRGERARTRRRANATVVRIARPARSKHRLSASESGSLPVTVPRAHGGWGRSGESPSNENDGRAEAPTAHSVKHSRRNRRTNPLLTKRSVGWGHTRRPTPTTPNSDEDDNNDNNGSF
jgi:hypothetical protein